MAKQDYSTITIDRELKNQLAERMESRQTWGHFLETQILRDGEGA